MEEFVEVDRDICSFFGFVNCVLFFIGIFVIVDWIVVEDIGFDLEIEYFDFKEFDWKELFVRFYFNFVIDLFGGDLMYILEDEVFKIMIVEEVESCFDV